MAGDVKMVGDIDGDGKPDLVIGGMPGEGLNWYRNPDWERTPIATPSTEFTTDAALGDLDGDGDLDIVVPDGNGADNLVWFVNPRPAGSPANPQLWQRRPLGGVGDWAKDVRVADFDGDGRLDVAVRSAGALKIYFQTAADVWAPLELSGRPLGLEGLASGDIDGDGHVDLVVRGAWLRNPGGAAARDNGGWATSPIGDAPEEFKALVSDLDGDGKADVIFSSSEGTAAVVWWRPGDAGPSGQWSPRTVVEDLERAHTLQAADIDGDGDNDLVVGQMHTSAARELFVLFNEDGAGGAWRKELVSAGGMHNGVVADVDGNGRPEIYGANWTGNPPLRLYVNQLGASVGLDNQVHLPAIR
jgi:hypothetical protein